MAVFPTLSIPPDIPFKESTVDNILRSNFEGGYELTRPRFTRIRRTFEIKYTNLPTTDKDVLKAFFDNVGCYDSFEWTHPQSSEIILVRFVEPLEFEYVAPNYWNVTIKLREV